jgi:hypothetical protein
MLPIDPLLDADQVGAILHLPREKILELARLPPDDPRHLTNVGPNRKRALFESQEPADWVARQRERRNGQRLTVYPDATDTPPQIPVRRGPLPSPSRGRPVRSRKAK